MVAQELTKNELNYKPVNLDEAVDQLMLIHQDSTKQKILEMSEDEFVARSHFGLGMWMRNNWGLWKGKELANYFNSIGIFHADDMSGIILTSFYRELNGEEWRVAEEVQGYQKYWAESVEHMNRLENDPDYRKMISDQQDSIRTAALAQKQLNWTQGKKVSGYVEHRCGLLQDFVLRTKIEGTIIEWKEDKLLLQIDNYLEPDKRKRIIKCYDVVDEIILIEQHELFSLMD